MNISEPNNNTHFNHKPIHIKDLISKITFLSLVSEIKYLVVTQTKQKFVMSPPTSTVITLVSCLQYMDRIQWAQAI